MLKHGLRAFLPRQRHRSPHGHCTRGLAASLAPLRMHSIEEVQSRGGWASASSFRSRYLMHDTQDISCLALTTLTQVTSGDLSPPTPLGSSALMQ
ncbi:hypothetical protein Pcinc_013297 [Petrolisthes cinctipes]|uniref:Uncharacterized protein n=1 Tax=Petrolisthes cinctipes TaxID=88211 RepID=A0AAE1FYU1_PETCI|nr:hypothetical protein Pcinc_013297 [Petrolisthes cinctipes]